MRRTTHRKTHTRAYTHTSTRSRAHTATRVDASRVDPRRPASTLARSRARLSRTRLPGFPLGVFRHLVIYRLSRFRLRRASFTVSRRPRVPRPNSTDRSIDSIRFVRAFVVSHLRQVRFLEALSHHLSARVGVLEVAHTGDAPVRRAHLRARRRRGHDGRRGVTTAWWGRSDSLVSHDSWIDRWDAWQDGDGLTED